MKGVTDKTQSSEIGLINCGEVLGLDLPFGGAAQKSPALHRHIPKDVFEGKPFLFLIFFFHLKDVIWQEPLSRSDLSFHLDTFLVAGGGICDSHPTGTLGEPSPE